MGKTFRRDWDEGHSRKEKTVEQPVVAYCLDCKQELTECPKDHLCPNCSAWLMETENEDWNESR